LGLLFFGPSGTGKSHLARYVAHQLDRDALCKRGSDLLSPYVGETEHNIRQAYVEAEARGAILIFDEADSLIFSREQARHQWERSFTNEFLNGMEQFSGIQIFTTNRSMDLDIATFRRLNYKLEFGYLEADAKVSFFRKMFSPLLEIDPEDSVFNRLKKVPCLTPGDFKTVRDRLALREEGTLRAEDLVAALEEESRVKADHEGTRHIGFAP
jgi:SpoVK/Ycf46/Vps4 family AAA+-type ATPase